MSDDTNVCCAVRALQEAASRAKSFYQMKSGRPAGFETLDLEYRLYRLRKALGAQDKCMDADCPHRGQGQLEEETTKMRA
jgi:hypothetical protein